MKTILYASLLSTLITANAPATEQVAVSSFTRAYAVAPGITYEYQKPAFWAGIGRIPSDWVATVKRGFTVDNLPWIGAITASTLVMIEYDEKINKNIQRAGTKLSISKKDKTKTFLKFKKVSLFRGPTDLGSGLYFLGDGWVPLGVCASFLSYGWAADNWRASHTGGQLVEGLLVTGISTQLLKRSTGRETPSAATAPRGVWRFFPSFEEFGTHRTRYDAFPSGHLATGMMAVTVIAENYPENSYVKPLGYALLAGLSFQMVNNGVHWASDYPLGLAIGYVTGKVVASHGRTIKKTGEEPKNISFYPSIMSDGLGAALTYKF